MVENHYDFINVHHHNSNVKLDRVLIGLAADDSNAVDVDGIKIHVPSPNFHAFFLMRHAMNLFSLRKSQCGTCWTGFQGPYLDELSTKAKENPRLRCNLDMCNKTYK